MPKIEVHDKQSAWAKLSRGIVRSSPPRQVARSARRCACDMVKGTFLIKDVVQYCDASSAKTLVMWS